MKRSAWELGRFSAALTLRGVYRVFLRLGSPGRMLVRATSIFESFYRPGEVRYHPASDKEWTLEFLHIEERSGLWEYAWAASSREPWSSPGRRTAASS